MIRSAGPDDYDRLIDLWLASLGETTPRLSKSYLSGLTPEMRQVILPNSETTVFEAGERILGFISILDGHVLSFHVAPASRSGGVGRQLLDHVKTKHECLSLDVFSENERAISFYVREGFSPTTPHMHDSGHELAGMKWRRLNAPTPPELRML